MSYSVTDYPYDCVCYITSTLGQGSGVLIGPHTVLTASHLLWDSGSDQSASDISVRLEYSAGGGSIISGQFVDHFYQIDDDNGLLTKQESQYDFAIIDFATNLSSYGYFGVQTEFAGGTVHVTGYPASSGGLQNDQVGSVSQDATYSVLDYVSVTPSPGNSGGPIWVDLGTANDPLPYVVGVVSTSGWGVQLTSADWQTIASWEDQDSYLWGGTPGGGGTGQINLTTTLIDVNTNTGIGIPSTVTVAGGLVNIHYKISNAGSSPASAGDIGYYISEDSTITASDTRIVYANLFDAVPANGDTGDIIEEITLPSNLHSGTWYLGVIADYNDQVAESNDNDNASVGLPITITGGGSSTYVGVGARNESFDLHLQAAPVSVNGSDGTDLVWGSTASDTLRGGAGRDVVIGDSGNDTLFGDTNTDSPVGSADQLLGGVGDDTAYGAGGSDYINGEAGRDGLYGGTGNDLIYGGFDSDHISGGAGNDQLWGGSSANPNGAWFGSAIVVSWNGVTGVTQAAQGWTIAGEAQSLDASNDTLRGGAGNDLLWGQRGADKLFGDGGNDTLAGGAGNDTFVFAAHFGKDVITDFIAGPAIGDVIEMHGLLGSLAAVKNHAHLDAHNHLVIVVDATDTITLNTVHSKASLSANDFHFM